MWGGVNYESMDQWRILFLRDILFVGRSRGRVGEIEIMISGGNYTVRGDNEDDKNTPPPGIGGSDDII